MKTEKLSPPTASI